MTEPIARRQFIRTAGCGGLATAAAFGGGVVLNERDELTISRQALGDPDSRNTELLTVAVLADMHLRRVGRYATLVADATNGLSPDLIVIPGDAIERGKRMPELASFMDLLDPAVPKVGVYGNWERAAHIAEEQLRRLFEAHNGRFLVNESIVHSHRGKEILLTGLDDFIGSTPRIDLALKDAEPRPNHLIIEHCPEYRDDLVRAYQENAHELRRYEPQCVISGHTHGGQITVLGAAPWVPRGSGRYLRGWYRDHQPHLYVSRGIGTTLLPIRFGSRPELTVFEWHLA